MTVSSATLTTLRDRVEQVLFDTGNAIWSTTALEESVRQALHEYSYVYPDRAATTLTLSADTRELDISSVTGLLDVLRCWLPYTSSSPEHPPNWRLFQHWRDLQILYFSDGDEPQNAEVARLFYTKMQTLSGLDSAAATTFSAEDESMLITGAVGYAATSRSVDLQEQITLTTKTGENLKTWGEARLKEFRNMLGALSRLEALRNSAHVQWGYLDRWDRDSEGWS